MLEELCAVIIIGLPGSGKSTASDILSESSWNVVSAGDTVRSMCLKEGLDVDRDALQVYGESFFRKCGANAFSSILINKAPKYGCTVFEGIRPIEVIKKIQKTLNCWVIYIESNNLIRFEMLKTRDHFTQHAFSRLENNSIEKQVFTM
ncbi:MAG: AAA family ATPase, partial [Methylococcaceae bacterium]